MITFIWLIYTKKSNVILNSGILISYNFINIYFFNFKVFYFNSEFKPVLQTFSIVFWRVLDPAFVSLFCFLFFPFIIQYLTKHDTWNTRLSLQSHRTKSRQMAWELSLSQYLGGMYQSPALYDIWSSVIALRPSGTDEWRRDRGMTFKDWQTEWQRFEYLIICSFNSEVSIQHCHFESLCSVFLNGILSVMGAF